MEMTVRVSPEWTKISAFDRDITMERGVARIHLHWEPPAQLVAVDGSGYSYYIKQDEVIRRHSRDGLTTPLHTPRSPGIELHMSRSRIVANGKVVPLSGPVRGVLAVGDLAVLVLEPPKEDSLALHNIYAIDNFGEISWRVQPAPNAERFRGERPYAGVRYLDGRLFGIDYSERYFSIDPDTGCITGGPHDTPL